MKMGTPRSPWHFDAAAWQAIGNSATMCDPALRLMGAVFSEFADGPVILQKQPFFDHRGTGAMGHRRSGSPSNSYLPRSSTMACRLAIYSDKSGVMVQLNAIAIFRVR